MKKVLVALPDEVVSLLYTELSGKLGEGRSDTLRTIIMNWLGEQGYLARGGESMKKPKLNVTHLKR